MDFRSYVISWNITRRCNLNCDHCYMDASPSNEADDELSTEECFRVADQVSELSPGALVIMTGGEPLLRKDVFQIARYASNRGLIVVMGTNGVLLTESLAARMLEHGIRGVGISIDSIAPERHDAFRRMQGSWSNSVRGMEIVNQLGLPFVIQTTVSRTNYEEIPGIIEFAYQQGAKVFNLYFLVPAGRGKYMTDISEDQYETLLPRLPELQSQYLGKLLINAKCAPHFQRVLYERDPASPALKTFANAGGCPAATQYCAIAPNGDVAPCPYLPVYGGNLRSQSFGEIWNESEVFRCIRDRKSLGGRCGPCEFRALCGGCRARAYGSSGEYMTDDPWCVYQPGRYQFQPIQPPLGDVYGVEMDYSLTWTEDARERATAIPAFVRGMVLREIERFARQKGATSVTPELMAEAREKLMRGSVSLSPPFLRRHIQ